MTGPTVEFPVVEADIPEEPGQLGVILDRDDVAWQRLDDPIDFTMLGRAEFPVRWYRGEGPGGNATGRFLPKALTWPTLAAERGPLRIVTRGIPAQREGAA